MKCTKKLYADPKAIQQMKIRQLKQLDANYNLTDEAENYQSFVLMI